MAYLSWLLAHFDGDIELTLAGYNAGEGAVRRHGGVPPYAETRDYVRRILERYDT
jgi:soluble lytic murein transglycosylase-like protein